MSLDQTIKRLRNMDEIHCETVNKVVSDIKRSGNVLLVNCNVISVDRNLLGFTRLQPMFGVERFFEKEYKCTSR
jgi:hypothetical protein